MGLLAHFLYWTIFGHLHPSKALPEQHKMALFTAIHTVRSHRDGPSKIQKRCSAFRLFFRNYADFLEIGEKFCDGNFEI